MSNEQRKSKEPKDACDSEEEDYSDEYLPPFPKTKLELSLDNSSRPKLRSRSKRRQSKDMKKTNKWVKLFGKVIGRKLGTDYVTQSGKIVVEVSDTTFMQEVIRRFYGHEVSVKTAIVARSERYVERLYLFVEEEIITLAMFVEEHSDPPAVAKRAYIQYVEKSGHSPLHDPKPVYTLFEAAIVSYLRYIHQIGRFKAVHLWAKPPDKGSSHLFFGVHSKTDLGALKDKYKKIGQIAEFKASSFSFNEFIPPIPQFNLRKAENDPSEREPKYDLLEEVKQLLEPVNKRLEDCIVYDLSVERFETVQLSRSNDDFIDGKTLMMVRSTPRDVDIVSFGQKDMNCAEYPFMTKELAKISSRKILDRCCPEEKRRKRVRLEQYPDRLSPALSSSSSSSLLEEEEENNDKEEAEEMMIRNQQRPEDQE